MTDIFIRDLLFHVTFRASVDGAGNQVDGASSEQGFSADGRFIAFRSASTQLVPGDSNNLDDVFIKDLLTGTVELVTLAPMGQANAAPIFGLAPVVSQHGRYVMFTSNADNLVANDTNGKADVFVRDRVLGTTTRISVTNKGFEANDASLGVAMDWTGTGLAFNSTASNLIVQDTNQASDVFLNTRKKQIAPPDL